MKKRIFDLLITFLFILSLELMTKIIVFKSLSLFNFLNILFFTLGLTIFIYILTTFFKRTINFIIYYFILSVINLIFIAQIIYFKTYEGLMSLYSMRQTTVVTEFGNSVLDMIYRNIFLVFIFLIPLVILIILNKKVLYLKRIKFKLKPIFIGLFLIVYLINIALLQINKNDIYSSYSLYYKDFSSPLLAAEKFGLLTTMRLDLRNTIFNKEDTFKFEESKIDFKINLKSIYLPNVLKINFKELINNSTDETIKNMHQYFSNRKPTIKNEYTGIFKDKNLIVILAEAFDPIGVDETITPTLYKLVHSGFEFKNFYAPLFISTIDGEFFQQTSLLPNSVGTNWSMKQSIGKYLPYTFGNIFKDLDYKTTAFHNGGYTYYSRHLSVPNLGYSRYIACGNGLNINCKQWPKSDLEMMQKSIPMYINEDKFMTYYITISGHLNYTRVGNMMVSKNWSQVKELPYSDIIKGYIATQIELDKALEYLIEQLEAKDKLEDTVIVLCTDHYPYGLELEEINEVANPVRDNNFEKHRSHLIIWNSELEHKEIETLSSNIDVLPTVLNLFGANYDSRLYMGKDILSDDEERLVVFSNRSWISEQGRYNFLTKESSPKLSSEYISSVNQDIYNRFKISKLIIDKNYYQILKNKD
ncbi:MAG: sulfatase-like hydrolase/transferase [Bacilli bacterium]|jgi:phosphoglycerol transferase MdoB-like AlkP superfamily enzyme